MGLVDVVGGDYYLFGGELGVGYFLVFVDFVEYFGGWYLVIVEEDFVGVVVMVVYVFWFVVYGYFGCVFVY